MKTQYHHTVLTDSLERELLEAELSRQMALPLNNVFSGFARGVSQLAGKLLDFIHAIRHAAPRSA